MPSTANGKFERNCRTRQYLLSFITCPDTCTRFDVPDEEVDSRGRPVGWIGPRNLGNPLISTRFFPTSCTAVSDFTSVRFIVPRCLCVTHTHTHTYIARDTSGNYIYSVALQSRRVNNKGALLFFQLVSQVTRRSARKTKRDFTRPNQVPWDVRLWIKSSNRGLLQRAYTVTFESFRSDSFCNSLLLTKKATRALLL